MNKLPFEVLCVIYSFNSDIKYCSKYYNSLCQMFNIKDIKHINKQLKYLTNKTCIGLSMDYCKSINIIGYNQIMKFDKLKYLSLANTNVNNNCLQKIFKIPSLLYLNISNCINLTYSGFRHINKLYKLKKLIMDNLLLSSNVYKFVAQLKELRLLSIQGCYITGDSIQYINTMKNLSHLYCNGSFATFDIFNLKNNTKVVSLSSIIMLIPDEIKTKTNYNNITMLMLDNLRINDNIVGVLKYYTNLVFLSMQHCNFITTSLLYNINKHLKHIETLNIYHCHQFIGFNFHVLSNIKQVLICKDMCDKHNYCKKCKYGRSSRNNECFLIKLCNVKKLNSVN